MDGRRESPLAWAKRRRAHLEAKAARRERLRKADVELILSGKREEVLASHGIDLLARPRVASADGGASRIEQADMPPAPPTMSEWIRAVVNDPEREKERQRLKRGGSHDAKDVPEDAPPPVSWPPQPWEQM